MDLGQFKRTLVLVEKQPIPRVLESVQALRSLDKLKEGKERLWLALGLAGFCAALIFVLALFPGGTNPAWTVPCLGLSLLGAVAALVVKVKHGRHNLDNRRYEFLDRLLRLLQADTAENGEVDLRLDLRPHQHRSKLVREAEIRGWKVKFFADPWLKLQGRLLDGTRYSLTMIEKAQQRTRWKRNPRGKVKHKTKSKSACEALLSLQVKEERYQAVQDLRSELAGAVQLPPWAECKGIETREGLYRMRAIARTAWDVPSPGTKLKGEDAVELVAMMFLSFYQALNLARALKKPGGGQSTS